ncbi:MAG: PQQ-binding-like beta-propeller repeat protein, partial [Gemmataceae bacterium]|nr:PQQ-binding-like beta-propeller repeat protein [Gemmataceae bacterium]
MLSKRRAVVVWLSLGLLILVSACSSLLLAQEGDTPRQANQAKPAVPGPGQPPRPAPAPPEPAAKILVPQLAPAVFGVAPGVPGRASEFTDAITLPTDRDLKKRLEAAEEYIKEEAWGMAARLLQSILDSKEDVFVQVRRKGLDGQETIHWASARAEANRLIGRMPLKGVEFYQLQYGAQGTALLEEAKKQSDPQLLAEVAQKYFHTEAGAEATNLLGTYHLDRGRPLMAALCFERLLQRDGSEPIAPLILLKTTLAYRLSGDQANAQQTLQRLTARIRRDGLRVTEQTVSVEQLQRELDKVRAPEAAHPFDWPIFRGNLSRSAQGNGSAPFLDKRWQRTTIPERYTASESRQTKHLLDEAIASLQRRPESLMPGFFPIAAAGKLMYRSYWGIHAVDIRTGELAWESPSTGSLDALVRDVQKFQQVKQWFDWYKTGGNLNVLFENSTLGTLSTDNTFVYVVDDLALPPHPNTMHQFGWGAAPNFGLLQEAAQQSRLQAFDLESGKLIWELGGPRDTSELNGSYFLGPPLPLGGKLYVLTEKNSELRLVCLDPARKGELVWTQALATTRDRLLLDPGRRVQSVNLAYGEGILVCPTNAGAVLGIDLLSHSLVWAHPYREGTPAAMPQRPFPPGRPWMNPNNQTLSPPDWKVSAPIVQDGKVVFTAPDGAAVHCLNLRNGDLLWEAKRVDDLYLAGVFGGKVVLVGKSTCRALQLADGKPLWKVETGLPSGQGVASDNIYYLPLKKAEVCAIDLERGVILGHARSRKHEVPGNLLFYEGDVLSQTETAVTAYPQLKVKLAQIDELLQRNPQDPLALSERGELRLDQGHLVGAVADLRQALTNNPSPALAAKTRDKLYDTLKELLQRDFSVGEEYLDEFKLLCSVPVSESATAEERKQLEKDQRHRQAGMWGLVAKGREQQGRLLEAFQAYLEFATLAGTEEQISVPDDPSLKARGDVWAQGRIAALVAKANAEQRKPLEDELAQRWRSVQASKDTEGLRRFVLAFGSLFAVGREARLVFAERLIDENNFIEAELNLLQLRRQQDDVLSAAKATEALARLATRKGLLEDAAHYYRLLGKDFAGVSIRDGKTGADFYNELATDKRFLPFLDEPGAPRLGGSVK